MLIPIYKRIASFIFPVLLEIKQDYYGKEHKVELYRNQLMLSTTSAIYSFGIHYYPISIPLSKLRQDLKSIEHFLMLGTGLGSGLKILQEKYSCYPHSTLVDFNQTILELSEKYMNLNTKQNVHWICQEASYYVDHDQHKYDLISIDIFVDMSVPLFIKSNNFISTIKKHLNPAGIVLFNLTFSSKNEQLIVEERLKTTFNQVDTIKHNINFFYMCRN